MRVLFPPLEPVSTWCLETGGVHRVYVEDCGSRDGTPVVFLHGGPGSGCKPYHRQFFNPARYRVILFDQRGCGRSTPAGATAENTTADLIADMEAIRERLGIERWVLFGGSWGATLALLYAQRHPGRVLAMILRGTFLARRQDVDWFFRDGVSRIFPDAWETFTAAFPAVADGDYVAAACEEMRSGDPARRTACARAWSDWTGKVVTYLLPESPATEPTPEQTERMRNEVSVETHYAQHRYFIEENQVLRDVPRLPRVPTVIVHGRRDLTCTLEASWTLHRALPHSRLVILREAGHLASEPAMIDALVSATEQLHEALQCP